jgi:hypothetical protein
VAREQRDGNPLMPHRVTLSLISHTNVGKTTLARTLLRRDVGEVLDQAHVTDESTEYELIRDGDDILALWDTPGFGDTARLMKRLRHHDDPLGWFLHQVWDRLLDRPMWCGQQAVLNVREHADVVLYLVNASESPEAAGYPALELELLSWIGRPVLILLNQVGDTQRNLTGPWREFAARWPIVRDVLSLDAFTRSWVDEVVLFERVAGVLDGPAREAMERLAAAWKRRNNEVFVGSCRRMAVFLARAATDRQLLDEDDPDAPIRGPLELLSGMLKLPHSGRGRAMEQLGARLDRSTDELMAGLITDHGLVGESARHVERELHDIRVRGGVNLDERSGALAGAVVSGALGGLMADALSGGLTLGGGLIAGTILGALGGSALAKGFRLVGGTRRPSVRWSHDFLDELFRQVVLQYLAVAHFGRGQGQFKDLQQPAYWVTAVETATEPHAGTLQRVWEVAEREDADDDLAAGRLERVVEEVASGVLRRG